MAVYALNELKLRITDRIYENHERRISGPDLQEMLHDIIDSLAGDVVVIGTAEMVYRADTITVHAGLNGVVFNSAFPEGSDYILNVVLSALADDHQIGGVIGTKTINGFALTVDEDATLTYFAIIKDEPED